MENPPSFSDDDPDAKEVKNKRQKKQKNAENIWQKLEIIKRKGGVSEEARPLLELTSPNAETQSKTPESEAPLTTLSSSENKFVEREITVSRLSETKQSGKQGAEITPAEAEAIKLFYDKIVHEGQGVDAAFAEVLEDLQDSTESAEDRRYDDAAVVPTQPENELHLGNQPADEVMEHNAGTPSVVPVAPQSAPANKASSRPSSFIRPRATAIPPRGTGMYRLNSMASGPGFPAIEHMRGYDEVTLGNIPGAIVGYLIGRRRGRIKVEKDLHSVKKKMEKKVKEVEDNIIMKEAQIQKMAHERAREQPDLLKPDPAVSGDTVKPAESEVESIRRSVAPEANQLHGKDLPPERIGHVLITGKPKPEHQIDAAEPTSKSIKAEKEVASRRATTMSRSELLDLSEEIVVDNTTLRHVYDTHLIGESGLRRLVYEHMRGGNVQEALHHEILEHDTEYERDPQLRHRLETGESTPAGGGKNESLGNLLKNAGLDSAYNDNNASGGSKPKIEHTIKESGHKTHQFRALDVAFASIILVLIALVAMLIISRG